MDIYISIKAPNVARILANVFFAYFIFLSTLHYFRLVRRPGSMLFTCSRDALHIETMCKAEEKSRYFLLGGVVVMGLSSAQPVEAFYASPGMFPGLPCIGNVTGACQAVPAGYAGGRDSRRRAALFLPPIAGPAPSSVFMAGGVLLNRQSRFPMVPDFSAGLSNCQGALSIGRPGGLYPFDGHIVA